MPNFEYIRNMCKCIQRYAHIIELFCNEENMHDKYMDMNAEIVQDNYEKLRNTCQQLYDILDNMT